MTSALLTGFSLMLSLILAIGAQNAYVIQQGVRRQHITAVVLSCFAIDTILMSIGVLGVGSIISRSETLLRTIAIIGGLALWAYGLLALKRVTRSQSLDVRSEIDNRDRKTVLAELLVISLLNPHVYLDTVVLVGSVGAQQPEQYRLIFLLGASLASLIWFSSIGFGAALLRPVFTNPLAWKIFDTLIAAMMFYLGHKLITQAAQNTVL